MGYGVEIRHPTLPDVREPISSFAGCPGNMYYAVYELTGLRLCDMPCEHASDQIVEALQKVIAELDKGNDGMFNDQYACDADLKWSQGRETREEYSKWGPALESSLARGFKLPFNNYPSFCGWTLRERIRETAVRFMLYYLAGYKITYTW